MSPVHAAYFVKTMPVAPQSLVCPANRLDKIGFFPSGHDLGSFMFFESFLLSAIQTQATLSCTETNGVAERAVRRVKEGTATALVQGGPPEEWWDCPMECYCYLRNVHDKIADGKTAFEKRYGQQFDGPSILFGTLVEYNSSPANDSQEYIGLERKR